jgi:hypothetical protein
MGQRDWLWSHVGTEGGEEQYTAVTVDFTTNTVEDGRGVHSIQDFIAYHDMDEQSINNKIKMASDAFLEKHSTI